MGLSRKGKLRQLKVNAIKNCSLQLKNLYRLSVVLFTPQLSYLRSQSAVYVSKFTHSSLLKRRWQYRNLHVLDFLVECFRLDELVLKTKANFKANEMNPSARTICKDRRSVKDCSLQHGRSGGLENAHQINSLNSYLNHW